MKPISPVMPGSESIEVVLGAGQKEYLPLPAVYLDTAARPMITRWELTNGERDAIAGGANIVLTQLTWRERFRPVHLQVVMPGENPELVEEPS